MITATRDAHAAAAVLERRARALAAPRVAPDDGASADRMEVLLFTIEGERLAIALSAMVAIAPMSRVTPLPRAAAPVHGVTAWRGRPLTVLSLGRTPSLGTGARLIVLGDGRRAVAGLLVGEVDETRIISRTTLVAAPKGPRRAMALGMTNDAILVLDADAMLDSARSEP